MAGLDEFVGASQEVVALRVAITRLLERLQGSHRPPHVLLQGETGTGKGLVARLLHDHGPRASGPFVDVNCAAIPDTLLEAELFGFERGAFTDARRAKPGLFQSAHRGTIFLDEIALLPEALQAKLLKVLEERSVRRLGATHAETSDFWLLAATNAHLPAAVAERRFREDLYQRLAVVTLTLPPLRGRGRDVLTLADHFLDRAASDHRLGRRQLTAEAREALLRYPWPGNVRELANVMERVALFAEGEHIPASALDLRVSEAAPGREEPGRPRTLALDATVRQHLESVIAETGGNMSRAAAALGITRNTLRSHIRKLGLNPPTRRGRPPGPGAAPRPLGTPTVEPPRVDVAAPEVTIRWQTRLVTFLYAALDPTDEEWPGDRGRVLETMVEKIRTFGGRVDELSTASVGAIFDSASSDACRAAVQASLAMIKAVERQLPAGVGPPPLRAAIHTAKALVGQVGHEIQLERAGKAAVSAVLDRLVAEAAPGMLVVSPIAATFLERRFHLRPLGDAAPQAWAVLGHEKRGFDAVSRQTRMIGREQEIALLAARWRAAQDGRGQLVLVAGDAGLGKSRLLWEFRTSEHLREGRVFEVHASPPGQVASYGPFLELFRQYFHVETGDHAASLSEKVVGKLGVLAPDAAASATALLAFLGLPPDDPTWMDLSGRERSRRILDALRRILLAEVGARPVLFVIEDLHWLDPASRTLVDALVEGLGTVPLMVVASYRPPFAHDWGSRSYFTQLSLTALHREQAQDLLGQLLGAHPSLGYVRQRVLERAGGNPFFIEESVRALVDAGELEGAAGSHRAMRSAIDLPIPATIEELVASRLERLTVPAREVVEVAAVMGRDVPRSAIAGVLRRPVDALQQDLVELGGLEILVEAGSGSDPLLRFHHPLLQEVAHSRIADAQLRRLHARAHEVLRTADRPGLADDTERLARHAFHGGLWREAVGLLADAAQKAAVRATHTEAVAHLEMALGALAHLPESPETLERGVDIRLALKSSLTEIGDHARVLEHLEQAEALAERLGAPQRVGRAAAFIGDYYRLLGDWQRARDQSERALALARDSGDVRLEVMANTYLGMARHAEGAYAAAAERFRTNVEIVSGDLASERLGMTTLPAILSRTWLAVCLTELGDFDEAERLAAEGVRIAEGYPQPVHAATAAAGLGRALLRRGRIAEALPVLSHGLDLCRANRIGLWVPMLASALGLALARARRHEEGLPLLEESITRAASDRVLAGQSQRFCWLGEGYLAAGRMDEARATAAEAMDAATRFGQQGNTAWAHWLSGEVLRLGGDDPARAAEEYRAAAAQAATLNMRPLAALADLGLGRALQALGGDEPARLIATAQAAFRALGMTYGSTA
jgi:transcriptional regulator with AAA-type ATPase domain/tetratricopeptide (TPR) repeat protein